MELVRKKEFIAAIFNLDDETFIVYITFPANSNIYLFYKVWIVLLKVDKAPTIILLGYIDFVNIMSLDLVTKLPKYTKINNYTINLIDQK